MTTSPARLREMVGRTNERLGGVSIERMGGDNLAVTLCSHFDDAEGEEDENGWTEAATTGCDETLKAIRDHYDPVFTQLLDEIETKGAALEKISAIRDSIVGMQGFNFSEHAYPLVAALDAAGYEGAEYEIARKNLGTLIDQIKAAEARNAELERALDARDRRIAELEGARDQAQTLAKAVKSLLPIGDASKPDSAVFPIYVRMSELRALHEIAARAALDARS